MKRYIIYKADNKVNDLTANDSAEKLISVLKDGVTIKIDNRPDESIVKDFESIMDMELDKSPDEMDADLVDLCLDILNGYCGTAVSVIGNDYAYMDITEYYLKEEELDDKGDLIGSKVVAFAPNNFYWHIIRSAVRDAFADPNAHCCVPMSIKLNSNDKIEIKKVYALIDYANNDAVLISITDSVDSFGKDNSKKKPITNEMCFDADESVNIVKLVDKIEKALCNERSNQRDNNICR